MTIDAEYAAPLADPMHAMLDQALAPYLSGDLDATDDLVEALWEIIDTADRTPDLVRTLHGVIKALPPTPEITPKVFNAIGAAMEFDTPALVTPSYGGARTAQPAARTRRAGGPREGSLGDEMLKRMGGQPGYAWKIGDFAKEMGGASRAGALGAAMDRLVDAGLTIQVAEGPKRYLRTDDPDAPQQTTDTDTADTAPATPDAPADAPADTGADAAPAVEPADTAKTATAARRGAAKSGK
jgi:hypothetical protein